VFGIEFDSYRLCSPATGNGRDQTLAKLLADFNLVQITPSHLEASCGSVSQQTGRIRYSVSEHHLTIQQAVRAVEWSVVTNGTDVVKVITESYERHLRGGVLWRLTSLGKRASLGKAGAKRR
jgi:hypothetical protein